jgi:hypothetical protein
MDLSIGMKSFKLILAKSLNVLVSIIFTVDLLMMLRTRPSRDKWTPFLPIVKYVLKMLYLVYIW